MMLLSDTPPNRWKRISGTFWTVGALAFTVAMIIQPATVYKGAVSGLSIWWNIVFPSLLPFFIASELLMSFGLVKFMGVMLEPIMRPLFNVPGCGSFVFCVGYTSGYPISAMITARLRSEGLCTKFEAERLVSFTSNSSPLFLIIAVSVGMFGKPELAAIIAGSHYLANISVGLLLRFYGSNDPEKSVQHSYKQRHIFYIALKELTAAWEKEKRPVGKIIGDATVNSINNLIAIGGFITLFSVLIRLLTEVGFIGQLSHLFGVLLLPLGLSSNLLSPISSGIFELTIGTKMASEASAPLLQQLMAASAILGWSGLSAQTQVISMLSDTDIRITPYILSRIAQAVLAALYTALFFGPAMPMALKLTVPAVATLDKIQGTAPSLMALQLLGIFFLSLLILILCAILYNIFFPSHLNQR